MKIPTAQIKSFKGDESEALAQITKIRTILNDQTKLTSVNTGLRKESWAGQWESVVMDLSNQTCPDCGHTLKVRWGGLP